MHNNINGKEYFLRRLIIALEERGVKCRPRQQKADIDFHFGHRWRNPAARSRDRLHVIRLDGTGTIYPSTTRILSSSHAAADGIIYQSQFSKRCCDALLKPRKSDCKWEVIGNGADPAYYAGVAPISLPRPYNIMTSAKWSEHKRLRDTVEIFNMVERDDVGFFVTGSTRKTARVGRVNYLPLLDQQTLSRYYRSCNMFLFLSWIDNCPNNVVEALCAGLWCLVSNEGGTHELITPGCGHVFHVDSPFPHNAKISKQAPRIAKEDKLQIAQYITDNIDCKQVAVPPHVCIDNVADQYKVFFEQMLS